MLKVFSLPALKDNYIHVVADLKRKTCFVIDPGEATPVIDFLTAQNLRLLAILITHHHGDHIGGVRELQAHAQKLSKSNAPVFVYAPARERADIPFADQYLLDGDRLQIMGLNFEIMALPGHTLGHIAYYEPSEQWLFSGDVLFSMGCGRIFEGTMEQHYASLQRLKNLPPSTTVFCTHEYTEHNTQFCLREDSENRELQAFAKKVRGLRASGLPTVPFSLQQELDLNPFLRAKDLAQFTSLREARNYF